MTPRGAFVFPHPTTLTYDLPLTKNVCFHRAEIVWQPLFTPFSTLINSRRDKRSPPL